MQAYCSGGVSEGGLEPPRPIRALGPQPPKSRSILSLRVYRYCVAQVAAALGRAPGTIKAQLRHGRRKLARLLDAEMDRRSSQ